MKKINILLACALFVFGLPVTSADREERAICFDTLKENIAELAPPNAPGEQLQNLSYDELEGSFSKYYKNLSSFGVDLKNPDFEMRLHSFGEPTGYIHPPEGPYPTTTKTDLWDEAAKQHIIAEEFVRGPDNKRIFLGCMYFYIDSEDLMGVTRDRYVYDGELMAATKKNPDYKVWYNENISFDSDDVAFVTWRRLFIYPKSTQNDYFSKYDVLDGMPANEVDSLATILNPEKKEVDEEVSEEDREKMGDGMNFTIYKTGGDIITTSYTALMPVRWPENEIFPFNSYYRAIENQFPEFAENLSIRGLLSYEGMKKLIASRDETKYDSIWSVIADTRDVTKYYLRQKYGGDPRPDDAILAKYLQRLETIELEVDAIEVEDMEVEELRPRGVQPTETWMFFFFGGVVLLGLIGGIFLIVRRK